MMTSNTHFDATLADHAERLRSVHLDIVAHYKKLTHGTPADYQVRTLLAHERGMWREVAGALMAVGLTRALGHSCRTSSLDHLQTYLYEAYCRNYPGADVIASAANSAVWHLIDAHCRDAFLALSEAKAVRRRTQH